MTDRYSDTAPDIRSRFCSIASSLRELADRLDNKGLPSDLSQIETLSNELKQIGWNTLFVSSSIDSLVGSTIHQGSLVGIQNKTDQLRHVDSLHVAVEYFVRSVRFLKTSCASAKQIYPEINQAFQGLGDKLQEVADECQRP